MARVSRIPEDLAKALGAIRYYCREFDCCECPLSVKINFDEDLECVLKTTAPCNIEVQTEYSYTVTTPEED